MLICIINHLIFLQKQYITFSTEFLINIKYLNCLFKFYFVALRVRVLYSLNSRIITKQYKHLKKKYFHILSSKNMHHVNYKIKALIIF